jgi:O-glycosyl hydrolase
VKLQGSTKLMKGLAMRLRSTRHRSICYCWVLTLIGITATCCARAATITIDGSVTNQTIEGFGVNINYWGWTNQELKPVIDGLIDGAGMTLFRVVVNNGWEATNDNDDPNVMNWDYYNTLYSSPDFEKVWELISYLNQKGITNGIMLNFQGPGPDWMGGNTLLDGHEDEWAEMIVSLLMYARNTRHLQFNLVAPNNEPDLGSEGIHIPTLQYVLTLHKLAQKLDANGLSDVRLVGPDLSDSGTNWLPEIMADPMVMAKLAHFGLHSYADNGGGAWNVSDFIEESLYPDKTFWMTEFNVWCDVCEYGNQRTNGWEYFLGTASYLLNYLDYGASAGLVWEANDSFYPHHNAWSFWGLFAVDDTNAIPLTYTPQKNFYTLAQISRFVRPGARMIGTSDDGGDVSLRSFYHDGLGQFTLVGINTDTEAKDVEVSLQSLPAIANVDLYYTSSNTDLCYSATVAVTNGNFAVTVPGDCIFTLIGPSQLRPVLRAQLVAGGITILWPITATNYLLEASVGVDGTATWSAVTNAPQQGGQEIFVTVPTSGQQQFFRLRKL